MYPLEFTVNKKKFRKLGIFCRFQIIKIRC